MTVQNGTFSTSDGCTISYTLQGARGKNAPRLALIHSLALDRSVWNGVVERLGAKAEILTYDARGHGRSARPHMPYSADLFGRDLAELMDHIGWDSATVAGCSMGGCVAQAFAGQFPRRANGLVLIDTTAYYGPDAPKQFRDRAAAAKAKGMQGLIDFQITRWFSDGFAPAHPDRVKQATNVFLANDFECYASTCALLGDADLRPYLPSFKMPVAVVVGEEDYATPVAMAKALHDAIPQSSLRIIKGGRHLTPIECPDEIAGEIANLLGRI
ncbi:MAG TPA: alpha/beta hydrolase [Micropepsaceae bacterium]|jgi:3-oxoadipate enol-lactonase|nr:alpha/beta hydrolase [Micropepsaceae bacterium]